MKTPDLDFTNSVAKVLITRTGDEITGAVLKSSYEQDGYTFSLGIKMFGNKAIPILNRIADCINYASGLTDDQLKAFVMLNDSATTGEADRFKR
jgi:hypothetical protein